MRCAWKVNVHEGFFLRIRQPLPWGAFRLWGPFGIPSIFIPRDPKNGIDLGWGPGPGFSSPRTLQPMSNTAARWPKNHHRLKAGWTTNEHQNAPGGSAWKLPVGPRNTKTSGWQQKGHLGTWICLWWCPRRPKISKASKRHIKGIRSLQNLLQAL